MKASCTQVRNVTKTYAQKSKTYRALDEIDLDIEAGTLVALLGPSGSGQLGHPFWAFSPPERCGLQGLLVAGPSFAGHTWLEQFRHVHGSSSWSLQTEGLRSCWRMRIQYKEWWISLSDLWLNTATWRYLWWCTEENVGCALQEKRPYWEWLLDWRRWLKAQSYLTVRPATLWANWFKSCTTACMSALATAQTNLWGSLLLTMIVCLRANARKICHATGCCFSIAWRWFKQ